MAISNNSNNQTYSNETDGFKIAGGTTKRTLTVKSGDVELTGGGVTQAWVLASADFSTSSQTLVKVTSFADFPMAGATAYWFKYRLLVSTTAVATGFGVSPYFDNLTSKLGWRTQLPLGRNVADDLPFYGNLRTGEYITATGLAALTSSPYIYPVIIEGFIEVGAGSGSLSLYALSEVASPQAVTIYKGSVLELIKTF